MLQNIYSYAKAYPALTFEELEVSFRKGGDMNTHLIAMEKLCRVRVGVSSHPGHNNAFTATRHFNTCLALELTTA